MSALRRNTYAPLKGEFDPGELVRRRAVETLVRKAGLFPGDLVLDVACRNGLLSNAIARGITKCRVVACSSDPARLAGAQRNAAEEAVTGRMDFLAADPSDLPLDDERFPLSAAAFSLHALPDPVAVLAEMHRVTMYAGKVLVLEVDFSKAAKRPRGAKKNVFSAETLHAMREMGFAKVQVQKLNVLPDASVVNLVSAKRMDPEGAAADDEDEDEDVEAAEDEAVNARAQRGK